MEGGLKEDGSRRLAALDQEARLVDGAVHFVHGFLVPVDQRQRVHADADISFVGAEDFHLLFRDRRRVAGGDEHSLAFDGRFLRDVGGFFLDEAPDISKLRGEGAGIDSEDVPAEFHDCPRDRFHILDGDGIDHDDLRAVLTLGLQGGLDCRNAVQHITQGHKADLAGRLRIEKLRYIVFPDRRTHILRHRSADQRHIIDDGISADHDPAGLGHSRNDHSHRVFTDHIQHGIDLMTDTAAEGGVNALGEILHAHVL